jgi:hypothetical protein
MVDKLHPQVAGDSHLPQEIRVDSEGEWRFTQFGLLDIITKPGRPNVLQNNGTRVDLPADALISNLFNVAKEGSLWSALDSNDKAIQSRINAFRAVVAGIRAEKNGETVNMWQEHLLYLLKELGYTNSEVKSAVLSLFPPDDPDTHDDLKTVFNRAAGYVWDVRPGGLKIFD